MSVMVVILLNNIKRFSVDIRLFLCCGNEFSVFGFIKLVVDMKKKL